MGRRAHKPVLCLCESTDTQELSVRRNHRVDQVEEAGVPLINGSRHRRGVFVRTGERTECER